MGVTLRERVFAAGLALSLGAAGYHALAASGVFDTPSAHVARHLTFVCINCLLAAYCRWRPLWVLPGLAILTVQQTMSHGDRLVRWAESGRVDWLSAGVLAMLFLLLVAALLDGRDRSLVVARMLCPFGRRLPP